MNLKGARCSGTTQTQALADAGPQEKNALQGGEAVGCGLSELQ